MDIYEVRRQLGSGRSIYDIALRVAYYARVSTDKDEQLHSLSAQVRYYSDFITNNANWTLVDGYVDEGLSATSVTKRENFLRMIDDAKAGKMDFVVTKEISRFSRNTLDSIKYTQELLRYGVGVLFQSDSINTLLPDAELRLTIMSSIAQDEVRKISERVRFGFKRSIEQGRVLGNNKIWGYRKDNGRLVIDEDEAQIVRFIFDQYANYDVGIRAVAQQLTEQGLTNGNGNAFSFSTIKGILTNPKYKGYYCGNKTVKVDYRQNTIKELDPDEWVMYKDEDGDIVPAIVSEELWEKANKILARRSEKMSSDNPTSYQNKYKYSGKLLCMEHNVAYYRALYRYASGNKELWQCRRYSEQGKAGCDSPVVYTSELDEIMRGCYDDLITNRTDIVHKLVSIYSSLAQTSGLKSEIAKQEQQQNEVLRRKDKLLDLAIQGRITDGEFEQRNTVFNEQLERMRDALAGLQSQLAQNAEVKSSADRLRAVIEKEINFTDELPENVIDGLLDRVEVYKTSNRDRVRLKVFFKVVQEQGLADIARARGVTSVCSTQYI